ncbi:50S ribosomal protein L29 [Patescibacteria group bacterium]|nr:50S ribosomal protein L29 [Patescibacteria group bacterium]
MKNKDLVKLNEKERESKLKELKIELIKSRIDSSKSGSSRAKEIRKMIARILTINNLKDKEKNQRDKTITLNKK